MRKIFIVVVSSILFTFAILALGKLFIVTGVFSVFMPDPPLPISQYGEFPFTLVYEVDGQKKIIQDIIVCEYVGLTNLGTGGKYHEWTEYIKSTGEKYIILLELNSEEDPIEFFYFYYGNAPYYMNDYYSISEAKNAQNFSYIRYYSRQPNGEFVGAMMPSEKAFDKYGIRLVSWECAPPKKRF